MPGSKQLVAQDSSRRQRAELQAIADMPEVLEKELQRLDEEFWVSTEKLKEIVKRFREELDEGLSEQGGNIPMCISWVFGLPTGNEKGTFLALDLGGTNLRVCKVDLHGSSPSNAKTHTLVQEKYQLPSDIKTGDADKLWTYVSDSLERFMRDQGLSKQYSVEKPMPLGFTFSYPCTQHSIDHGILQRWTKGFDISGVEDHDVAAQLRRAITNKKLPIELVCVVNDTVGAMIASAYNDPRTIMGGIFGTGCNAAYMQHLSRDPPSIPKLKLRDDEWDLLEREGKDGMRMAINCEYGAFDNAHRVLPRTEYDKMIDEESPRPGQQTFEKLSAGLYLGEIFRLVLVQLYEKGLIFKDGPLEELNRPYVIDTGFLSGIEDDESPRLSRTRQLFQDVLNIEPTDPELQLARRLAELIAVRGARLCACGTAAIVTKENITTGHVAADGSVANKHPKFKKRWAKALGEILDWDGSDGDEFLVAKKEENEDGREPIEMISAEDGSGVGVAIAAAMTLERRERGNRIGMGA